MSRAGARKRLDKQSPTRHATTRRQAPVLATPWPRAAAEASGGPDGAGSPIDDKIENLPSQSGSAAMHVILMLLAMKIF